MITENINNIALYGDGWELTDEGAFNPKRNIRDRKLNLSNATFHDVQQPSLWSGGFYTYDGDFTLTAIGLAAAKVDKKVQLDKEFAKQAFRPIVDTGLGFEVNGGYTDLADFEEGADLGLKVIRAVDNSMNTVTPEEFQSVLMAIKVRGFAIKGNKWALADSITAATTESELDAININEGW